MPLSVEKLLSIASSPVTFKKGADYCRQNRVIYAMSPDGSVRAVVRGSEGNSYNVFLRFDGGGLNVLESYSCDCPAAESYEGACKHIVATVLALQSGMVPATRRTSKRPAAQLEGERLLGRSAQRIADKAALSRPGAARLYALLETTAEGGARLSFKVGEDRMYVIRDIDKFLAHMRNGDYENYGKKYSLWHNPAAFLPESRPMLRFIEQNFNQSHYNRYGRRSYSFIGYNYGDDKRCLYLAPGMVDEFFEICMDQKVDVIMGDRQKTCSPRVVVGDFKPRISLTQNEDTCILKCADEFHILEGCEKIYAVTDSVVMCCSTEYSSACGDLLATLAKSKNKLLFGWDTLTALYATVLAEAGQYIRIKADESLSAHKPPPLVTKIYFDSPYPDSVFAKMTFSYGANTHEAFGEKSLAQSFDLAGEIMAENALASYFSDTLTKDGYLFIDENPDAVYNLISRGLPEISSFAELYTSDSFGKIRIHAPASVSVGLRVGSDLLEMDFDVDGVDLTELHEILSSYRLAKKYHRLRDGSFLTLEEGALTQLSEIADGLDLTDGQLERGHAELPLSRSLYIDAMMKQNESIRYNRDSAFRGLIRGMNDVADADFAVPRELLGTLRNYQKIGYRWMRTLEAYGFGGILADDMGLGKTIQVLALLKAYRDENAEALPSIVVCPASLTFNWESESRKFTPDLKVLAVSGTAPERALAIEGAAGLDLIVTSYDQLKRDIKLYEAFAFAYIIVDEAQYIKNHTTQNAKAVKLLRGKTRLSLTGTPVENSLAELWSIFDFLMPGYLFHYSKFRKRYEEPIVRQGDAAASERLRQLVRPFLLRRLKRDVLKELPPKTETVLRSEMEDEQKNIYRATLAQVKKEIAAEAANSPGGGRIVVLAALTRLRQICCDPALAYDNYKGGSVKLEACLDLVESSVESGHRLLLFSQFTSMLDVIEKRLEALKIDFYRLDGSTKAQDRLELVESFNAGSAPVFLISLKAGGTGLNLTGADVVIHYDPWWNISAQNQATDRAHRIGQRNSVQVYKLIVKDSIEERIMKMQEDKAQLADEIVREGGNAFEGMSGEELLSLFEE